MKFGEAITLLNAGHKLQREGWNGKGQWLYLIPASHWETTRGLEMLTGRPWIGIKTVDDQFMPWVASQSDMLADDWMIYFELPSAWGTSSMEKHVQSQKEINASLRAHLDAHKKAIKNPVSVFGSAPVKAEGQPVSYTVNVAKPVRKPRKVAAPYGLKKDGTPKSKPGRKV